MGESVCFATVIFNQNLKFFDSFLNSLSNQTNNNFTLLLFNDGVDNLNQLISNFKGKYKVITLKSKNTIAQNRTELLAYLKLSDFEYCVFGDSDDYFPENRIAVNVELLHEHSIIINQLSLVDGNNNLVCAGYFHLTDKQSVLFEDVQSKNCFGLGNTAIKVKDLPQKIEFNQDIIAVDWLLFSRMLIKNKTAIFTDKTQVYYRQHDSNIIGLKSINSSTVSKGINAKISHFKSLVEEYNICNDELNQIKKLSKYCSTLHNLDIYINKVLSLGIINPMWWEEIKTLEELKIEE